ncbi:MAG: hypothetical protein JW836_17315 [Deltaproteobacteria bacterium]|nr:hypothetical protein [Deltaproteobacteria bacterium]
MSPELDRKALRDLSYGLYIVTSSDGTNRLRMLPPMLRQNNHEPIGGFPGPFKAF